MVDNPPPVAYTSALVILSQPDQNLMHLTSSSTRRAAPNHRDGRPSFTAPVEMHKMTTDLKKIIVDGVEEWREYDFGGRVYRINNPVSIEFRLGGATHRVTDKAGIVHCVPAPGVDGCVLRWLGPVIA